MSDRKNFAEAAKTAGIHVNTLRNWRKAGKLTTAEKIIENGVEQWTVEMADVDRVARSARIPGYNIPADNTESGFDPTMSGQPSQQPDQQTGPGAVLLALQAERESLLEKVWSLETQLQDAAFERGQLASLQQQIERLEAGSTRQGRLIGWLIFALVALAVVALVALAVVALLLK